MTDLWTFADDIGPIITAGQDVVIGDVQHPWNRDKDSIVGLVRVTPTPAPDARFYVVNGSHAEMVNGVPTQVRDAIPRSAEDAAAGLIAASKVEASHRILQIAPQHKQVNAALGIYDEATTAAIRTAITAHRQAQNDYEAAVLACATVDELAALPAPAWPSVT